MNMSAMVMTSSLVSSWKTIVSSIRFKDSGRKCAFRAWLTFSFMRSCVIESDPLPKPIAALRRSDVPRFEVMIKIVFLKSTARPWEVGETSVFEDLQQRVEHVGVRLFH